MALNADKILKHAGTYKTRVVHVPAWADEDGDDRVYVRGMTMREFELHQAAKGDPGKAGASLVARCVVTEEGGTTRMFRDDQIGTIAELGVRELEPILDGILTESGLTDEGEDEVLGKSETTPTNKPSTESPETSDASSKDPEVSASG